MNEYLEKAILIVDNIPRSKFESIWKQKIDSPVPRNRILIWGSVAKNNGNKPRDLDVIIEYDGESIEPKIEKSIEQKLHKEVRISKFSYLDPLVIHYHETLDIISKSNLDKVYSVDEKGWLKFN